MKLLKYQNMFKEVKNMFLTNDCLFWVSQNMLSMHKITLLIV